MLSDFEKEMTGIHFFLWSEVTDFSDRSAGAICPAITKQSDYVERKDIMGKFVLGWILGVPAVVLLGIYLVVH